MLYWSIAKHWLNIVLTLNQFFIYWDRPRCILRVVNVCLLHLKIEYSSHFISKKGIGTDPKKIEAMVKWAVLTWVKCFRSFLGSGYYKNFIRGYAEKSKPLTDLLKKGAFQWNDQAQQAFETLTQALVTTLVLALPNFDKKFVIETDASKGGIGVVLVQEGQPIAFISKSLGPKWQRLSVYEKELLAIVFAVQKW